MAHRLRMSAELGDWLAELCTFEPASAAEVGAAVVALIEADDPSGLSLVGAPTLSAADRIDPRQTVDDLYQRLLEALRQVRQQVADAAWARVGAERLITELDNDPQPDPAVRAWLSQARDKAKRHETAVRLRGHRLQVEVDRFRTTKETAKAMYTAAEATVRIHAAVAAAAGIDDPLARGSRSSGPANEDELATDRRAAAAAEAHLQAAAGNAARTLREILDAVSPGAEHENVRQPAGGEPVAGLLELRGDPLGRDVRLLLAFEPADTVMVLAVVDGEEAVTEHRAQAIELAGELLTDVRNGDWPPPDALGAADLEMTFTDAATFLARFFPADGDAIAARAAAVASAQSLAGLRQGIGMSLADLAVETGIDEERLRFIEEGGIRVAQVHEAVAYVRPLGRRLTLTVDGDGEPAIIAG